jgi:hypothetical protein
VIEAHCGSILRKSGVRPETPHRFAAYIRFLSQIRITNFTLQIETLSHASPSRG